MHALAHPIGAHRDAHHGLLNAIVMPFVLRANRDVVEGRIERLAAYLGLGSHTFDGFMDWLMTLREEIGIPMTLQAVGVQASDVEVFVPLAMQDPSAATNPVSMTASYTRTLLTRCVGG